MGAAARVLGVCLAGTCLLSAVALRPPPAHAGVLVLPNAQALPGELGFLLGGAQVALASSADALFANPAGLVLERDARLIAGGSLLRLRTAVLDGTPAEHLDAGPGSLAYAQALGSRRRTPRYAFGVGFAQSEDGAWPTRVAGLRSGSASALPPGSLPGVDVDATFPGGVTVAETGEALGTLRALGPVLGVGIAPGEGLRLGAAVRFERLQLTARRTATTTYAATANGGADTLSGSSQQAWVLAGDALRMATTLGLQWELAQGVLLGLVLSLPVRTLSGSGRLQYQRNDALVHNAVLAPGSVFAAEEGVPFQLESPRRVQAGLALRGERFLFEADVYHLAAQSPYEVLPGTASRPPSTLALALPALRTASEAVLGFAIGMAYAQSDRTSLLLSLSVDPSPVPPADALFRSVDFIGYSVGAYHVRGDVSGSIGLRWREGREPALAFQSPDGGSEGPRNVTVRELAVQMGGSVSF